MIARPHFQLPLWAALAIVGAAYVVRSLVLRGGDFTPDLPADAIVAVVIVIVVPAVAWARRSAARESGSSDLLGRDRPADEDAPPR